MATTANTPEMRLTAQPLSEVRLFLAHPTGPLFDREETDKSAEPGAGGDGIPRLRFHVRPSNREDEHLQERPAACTVYI